MRQSIYLLALLLVSICSHAQSEKIKSHYLKKPTVLAPVDPTMLYTREGLVRGNGISLDTIQATKELTIQELDSARPTVKRVKVVDTIFKTPIIIEKGFAYNVIQEIGSFSVIKFWPIKENRGVGLLERSIGAKDGDQGQALTSNFDTLKSLQIEGLKVRNPSNTTTLFDLSKTYYMVKTSVLKENSEEFENKKGLWNIGLLVLPVKVRPFATEKGQFDFADGFSVGTTFSWTVHHNWRTDFTHNFLLFVGLSSYTADSSKLKERRNDYKIAAFSPAIGWMWEKNNVQLSVLTGIDFPSGNLQEKWVYRNKPWVGVGVGIGLFKIGNANETASQSNKSVQQ